MLGSNVSTVGGIHRGFEQATAWECDCIQIYTTPSRRWDVPALDPARREAFLGALASSHVRAVVAHVPFLVNLASPDPGGQERSRRRLVEEILRADELGVDAVILHPGSGGDGSRDEALARAIAALKWVLAETEGASAQVLVENMAGQGGTLCARFEELSQLLDCVGAPERIGVCFDTAHAFIAGHALVGYAGYSEVMKHFDETVGCGRIRALHVNDSLTALGSRHDRHAPVGFGQMGVQVFHALIRDERFAHIPKVLEVPDRDNGSLPALKLLRQLRDRQQPLPADDHIGVAVQLSLDAPQELAA